MTRGYEAAVATESECLFSSESKSMLGLPLLIDGVWLSCLMALLGMPIVAIGVSLVVVCQEAHDDIAAIGKLTDNYIRVIKTSWFKVTLV